MRLATVEQARQIDELSQSVYGLSAETLMEAAGALASREISLSFLPELSRGMVAVVCGPGHNGGDGLVVARHLHSAGHRDLIVLICGENKSALWLQQFKRCELQGLKIFDLDKQPEKISKINSAALIVDALFGIGLKRKIEGTFSRIIEAMNSARGLKVALDTPSGLNANTGRVEGVAVKAAQTITFGLAKPGFFVSEGPSFVGKLRVLPIGFPHESLRGVATSHFLFSEKLARRYLPTRSDTSNKSNHGKLLVLAGRPGYWGAGVLASTSAFRMGAGYVTWASFEAPLESLAQVPEVLTSHVDDEKLFGQKLSAVAIGPGLGVGKETAMLIEKLKTMPHLQVVVDADAITAAVDHKLFPFPSHWIVTPHTGELARILKVDAQELERDRFRAALDGHRSTGAHVLFKGFRSILAYGERCLVIHSGNSALAKAGTGDVLTGMIGGLLAQGLDPLPGAATAAYLHGRLADEWVRSGNDKSSLTASDLGNILPQVVSRLRLGGGLY